MRPTYRRYRTMPPWRRIGAFLALMLAAVGAATAARADEPGWMIGDVGPDRIAHDVTIAGTLVGGMTGEQAETAVQASYRLPIAVDVHGETSYVSPARLGVPLVGQAVTEALHSSSWTAVPLHVLVDRPRLEAVSALVAREYSRPPVDAQVRLRGMRPVISDSRVGLDVSASRLADALGNAVQTGSRGPIAIEYTMRKPAVTKANIGPVIVISRSANRLYLYRGARKWKTFGVATGQAAYPTPSGQFTIVSKQLNPWWYPPASPWAAGMSPVPPGPGNPLGTRWMGLSTPGVGIHGTPDAASIGYSASHGCIRMNIPDAEWLYEHVSEGTAVFIV
jgi:lipoprotein-anchoring transpeptidase ErfK/SrfK